MTETLNVEGTIEPDFDDWLAGGERKAHFVTLYGRADLYADIEELERQRVSVQEIPEEDRGFGEDPNPNRELDEQIAALWVELDRSKREFRVSARTKDELDTIRAEVQKDLREDVDAAAAKARDEAKQTAVRLGIKSVNDINAMVRKRALDATTAVVENEVSLRAVADSTSMKRNGDWVPVSRDQLRAMNTKLGNSQMDLLNRAYARAANEAPVVDVPK